MNKSQLTGGTVHQMPADFKKALSSNTSAITAWQSLTPLARNEWICWVISVKQQKTRDEHTKRALKELAAGKRRPCCWMGCTHRKDKAISPSQKWVLSRQSKAK